MLEIGDAVHDPKLGTGIVCEIKNDGSLYNTVVLFYNHFNTEVEYTRDGYFVDKVEPKLKKLYFKQ